MPRLPCPLTLWSQRASGGSCALLGPNASGKSLALHHLKSHLDPPSGTTLAPRVQVVSFDSTMRFLRLHGSRPVHALCGGVHSSRARAIVVRFGLMPCWFKPIHALSSGELRKLTLATAVASQPDFLFLDGAHDGLDAAARHQLTALLASMVRGMPKLLVHVGGHGPDGAQARLAVRVLQAAQRAEEFPRGLKTVFRARHGHGVEEVEWDRDRDGDGDGGMMKMVTGMDSRESVFLDEVNEERIGEVLAGRTLREGAVVAKMDATCVQFGRLEGVGERRKMVNGGGIKDVWVQVKAKEVWVACGMNGAGKSVFGRVLSTPGTIDKDQSLAAVAQKKSHEEEGESAVQMSVNNELESVELFGIAKSARESFAATLKNVGVVSINSHMRTSHVVEELESKLGISILARHVIAGGLYGSACSGSAGPLQFVQNINDILCLTEEQSRRVVCAAEGVGLKLALLERPYLQLSLGEQRLVLFVRSIVHAPQLCVFDEACQGLDERSRHQVLQLIDCLVNKMENSPAILVVTHHADEVPESASHLLLLDKGHPKFVGSSNVDYIRNVITNLA